MPSAAVADSPVAQRCGLDLGHLLAGEVVIPVRRLLDGVAREDWYPVCSRLDDPLDAARGHLRLKLKLDTTQGDQEALFAAAQEGAGLLDLQPVDFMRQVGFNLPRGVGQELVDRVDGDHRDDGPGSLSADAVAASPGKEYGRRARRMSVSAVPDREGKLPPASVELRHSQTIDERFGPRLRAQLSHLRQPAFPKFLGLDLASAKNIEEIRAEAVVARLTVAVLEARGLSPKDAGGTSDPYVIVTVGKSTFRTSTVQGTLNPTWGEAGVGEACDFELAAVHDDAFVHAAVFDWNRGTNHVFMGEVVELVKDLEGAGVVDREYELSAGGGDPHSVTGRLRLQMDLRQRS